MTKQTKTTLKTYFDTGDVPNEIQFGDTIDSVYSNNFDVQVYGAVCNGIADDTAAIQAAFDAVETTGSGTLEFPYGTYNITSTIDLPYTYGTLSGYSIYKFIGHGSTIVYSGTNQLFKACPLIADEGNVSRSYSFEGFNFRGPTSRTSMALDLGCTTNVRIVNCNFTYFGIGVRLFYSFWPLIQSCNFYDCYRTGVWISSNYGLVPSGGTAGGYVGAGQTIDTTHFYSQTATNVDIEGMSRAAVCVVTWTGHGMETGDMIFLSGITQADWTILNKTRHFITRINDDSFSIPVDTSAYAGDYVPGVDPGHYAKHVSCIMLASGQVAVRQCAMEGNSGIDNIYCYGSEADGSLMGAAAHHIERIYNENNPVAKGSLICLDQQYSGYLYLNGLTHTTTDITILDAYGASSCVLDLNNVHVAQNAYLRTTPIAKAVNVLWHIKHWGVINETVDWTAAAYWIDGVTPEMGYGCVYLERFATPGMHYKSSPYKAFYFDSRVVNNECITFIADDATPGIWNGNFFKTANVNPTTITMFDYGLNGQNIKVIIGDAVTTVDFSGTNLKGNAGVDWTPAAGDWLEAVFDGADWYCSVHESS